MALGLIAAILISFFSMFIPGLLLAFALLKRTELHDFEIVVIGFIFGLIAPATLTWAESYLIAYSPFLHSPGSSFVVNALVLTVIGAILCFFEGRIHRRVSRSQKRIIGIKGKSLSAKSRSTKACRPGNKSKTKSLVVGMGDTSAF